jgi:hypothetical protein
MDDDVGTWHSTTVAETFRLGCSGLVVVVITTPCVSKYLTPLTFVCNFDQSSKNCASTIYFICYMF